MFFIPFIIFTLHKEFSDFLEDVRRGQFRIKGDDYDLFKELKL